MIEARQCPGTTTTSRRVMEKRNGKGISDRVDGLDRNKLVVRFWGRHDTWETRIVPAGLEVEISLKRGLTSRS